VREREGREREREKEREREVRGQACLEHPSNDGGSFIALGGRPAGPGGEASEAPREPPTSWRNPATPSPEPARLRVFEPSLAASTEPRTVLNRGEGAL